MAANRDVIRMIYEKFNKGDIEGVLASLDPDIRWQLPESLPFGGTYGGTKEVGRFFASLPGHFAELHVEPQEYLEAGEAVVVLGHHRGRGAAGPFEVPFAMVWTLRAGKPLTFREYQDTAKTLKAIAKA